MHEIPKFQLTFSCESFVETQSFRRVSRQMSKIRGDCGFPQNFHTKKLGKITVFYAAS